MKDTTNSLSRRQLVMALTMAAGAGCHADPNSAQGVAERFVDQHYVQMNLAAAEALCSGLAQAKVRESMRLTQGLQIDESTRKPTVRYRVTPKAETESEATYLFDATVQVDGADTFEQRWIVIAKRIDDSWKVVNYSEASE